MTVKPLATLICLACSVSATAATDIHKNNEKGGYSYFTAGFENVSYKEHFPGMTSKVSVTSPIINSGGLYEVNEQWDFSIDALGTFSPSGSEEEWRNHNGLIQTNQFKYIKAATNILVHYKMTPQWRLVVGPSLTYQTYKRYQAKPDNIIFKGTWEESATDIFMDTGIAFDSGSLRSDAPWHMQFKAIAGLPLWSATTNNAIEGLTFNDFSFRTSLEGSISYQVLKGIHLGWYAQMGYEKRFEEGPQFWKVAEIDGKSKKLYATLPEAETISFSTGLQVLWNLG